MTFMSELLEKAAPKKPSPEPVFAVWPELFIPAFWHKMHQFAKDPGTAKDVMEEMDQLAAQGATVSPKVGSNMLAVLQTARQTLRNTGVGRHNNSYA